MSAASFGAIRAGGLAVVTGGASGIGLAAVKAFAARGMRVAILDRPGARIDAAVEVVGKERGVACPVDVADAAAMARCAAELHEQWGTPSVLMNNAGVGGGRNALGDLADWNRVLGVNLMGVLHGVNGFAPMMIDSGRPGLIINTGSKQGMTQPPGDTAYNVSKAGVKALTEGLAHTLRERTGDIVSAHLLIPGFTFTGVTKARSPERPSAAWPPEQVIDLMLERLEVGDFYIMCPDNETTPEQDRKRIAWAAGDLIENQPALSRWHPDWKGAFERHMAD